MNGSQEKQCGVKSCESCTGLFWWMKLLVAVLAVPSIGIILAAAVPVKGAGEVGVFVAACWLCTWLGMQLMKNAKTHDASGDRPGDRALH